MKTIPYKPTTTVYKVVRETHDGELVSIAAWLTSYNVRYQPGVIAKPPIGKLFAFDNELNARQWGVGHQVWKCEAEGVKKATYMADFCSPVDWSRWWATSPPSSYHVPPGTVFCDSIKLVKQVNP